MTNRGPTATKDWAERLRNAAALDKIVQALPVSVAIFDADMRYVAASQRWLDEHKMPPMDQVIGALHYELFPNLPEHWLASHRRCLSGERVCAEADSIDGPDGAKIWFRWEMSPWRLSGDMRWGMMIRKDVVTEHVEREVALRAAEAQADAAHQRLVDALEAISDGFVIYDPEDRLVLCNEQFKKTYPGLADVIQPGVSFAEIMRAAIERGMHPDALGCEEDWIADRLGKRRNRRGSFVQELDNEVFLRIEDRRVRNGDMVGVRTDITALKRQQRQLRRYAQELRRAKSTAEEKNRELAEANEAIAHSALHDPLTELGNRRYLDDCLTRAMAEGAGVAVLQLDLDRFKQINDTLGHDAGDTVLRRVADVLRREVHGCGDAARIGGDEFVIVCPFDGDAAPLAELARRIIAALEEPILYKGQPCRHGVSIGVAMAAAGEVEPSQLLINADLALYRAKTEGRNRFEFFSEALQAAALASKKVSDELLNGLENGEFVAWYQPLFCARTGELASIEALARWRHPERGILAPASFLGIAEELKVTARIDAAVMRCAARDLKAMRAEGLEIPRVSVNVSARRLREPGLIDEVAALGLPKGSLAVELLEAIFLDASYDQIAWTVDQLRELGVEIELDDFGAGHTSVVSLVRLEPNRLKIDRELVIPIDRSEASLEVVRAIHDIGRALKIEVIAEGVETLRHGELLCGLGCDLLQGFALAKPMSREALSGYLSGKTVRSASL